MAEAQNSTAAAAAADKVPAKELTAADAAKQVRRPVYETVTEKDKAGDPVKVQKLVKHVAVRAEEVLSFKDYGSHVVVVTKDGQKFSSADAA